MSDWNFELTKQAQKNINELDNSPKERVLKKLRWFTNNFDELSPLPLSGKWKGFFKYRIGDYRVIYEVEQENKKIVIHVVGHRKEVYD